MYIAKVSILILTFFVAGTCLHYPHTTTAGSVTVDVDQLEGTEWVNDDLVIAWFFKKDGVLIIGDFTDDEIAKYSLDGNTITIKHSDGRVGMATLRGNTISYKSVGGDIVVLTKRVK